MAQQRKPKKTNKSSPSLSGWKLVRRVRGPLVVVMTAVVGTYLLIGANAASGPPDLNDQVRPNDSPNLSLNLPQPLGPAAAGQNFDLPIGLNYSFIQRQPGAKWQALIHVTAAATKAQYLGYSCKAGYSCSASTAQEFGSFRYQYRHQRHAMICINLPADTAGTIPDLITVHFKALQDLPSHNPYFQTLGWFIIPVGFAPGTCASNSTGSGVFWNGGFELCGFGEWPACDVGTAPAAHTPSATEGSTGNGTAGTGTGSGGGGGSSSATNQSNKPNSLPSASYQGTAKQPTLNPSPFYDGKQYAPGSDPLDKAFGNISVAGRKIAHGWVYLLGVLVLAGGAGFYYWRKRKT